MDFWKKLFGPRNASQAPSQRPEVPKVQSPPAVANAPLAAEPDGAAGEMNQVAKLMLEVKKPRYAHMAKFHEQRGQFSEAESNYYMLANAFEQTLGNTHPHLATVLYELALLNHHHEFPHDPAMQVIFDSLGRGFQVFTFYDLARNIRAAALGEKHPSYAQSLCGLAILEKDNKKTEDALAHVRQALAIQSEFDKTNSLGIARSTLCVAEISVSQGDLRGAMNSYEHALELLAQPSANLTQLEEARQCCDQATASASDYEASQVLTDKALALQRSPLVADPYFLMTFDLLGGRGQLVLDALELHRNQYISQHRSVRVNSLKGLSQAYQKAGEPARAIPLLEQAAELERNSR
jgi:tetratricopeptide (TPR) repeat protein